MPTPARSGCVADGLSQANKYVPVELEDVPVQTVCDAYGVVGKAMHRRDAQLVWAEVAEHHSAACRAKINSGHPAGGHRVPFDGLRAHMRAERVEARSLTSGRRQRRRRRRECAEPVV